MSLTATNVAAGLAPADSAAEPAWVRNGTSAVKQDYEVALGFEEMLVDQLASSLDQAGGLGGESESGEEEGGSQPSLGGGMLSSLLPGALSQGVVDGGGLGLAAQLTQQMQGVTGSAQNAGAPSTVATPSTGARSTLATQNAGAPSTVATPADGATAPGTTTGGTAA